MRARFRMISGAIRALGITFAAVLSVASGVLGQAPGYQQIDVGSIRAEYNAEVLTQINRHLADWGEAWANDDANELADLYWEDALFVAPDGVLRRGIDEIREYFQENLDGHGSVEAFMLDFDASGGMAQVFGNYMLEIREGEGAASPRQGPLITIYLLRGRTWKIRSQVFMPG